jgi:hypothetical protein
MPWQEDHDHNQRLLKALQALAREKGAIERLAGAIDGDDRSRALDRARQGDKHKPRQSLIQATTLSRWIKGGLTNAQPHKKRLVFEFLERSPEFATDIYRPEGRLPRGFLTFAAEHSERLAKPFDKDLSKLNGAFELYRPAWTTPHRRDRVLVSKLLFTTENGFTRFREEQDYIDPEFQNARVRERDEGAVFFTAANIILMGFGLNEERVKLYAASSWFSSLSGELPVTRLSGSMMGVSGRRDQKGYPFVAVRSPKAFDDITTEIVSASDPRFDDETKAALRLEAPK